MDNLKEKTANGLFWGLMNSGATQLLNLVIGIFLARLLTPADYGMVAMIAVFYAVAQALNDSGLGVALINKKNATELENNSIFAFNLVVAIILYATLFVCAPLIAKFFHEPELTKLSRFMFLTIFFSLGIVPNAIMKKKLMVKERAILELVSLVVTGVVGIILALKGYSYWSLAWQNFIHGAILMVGVYYFARWLPSMKFSMKPIKEMFGFSSKILITSLINILNVNILSVIFGRLFNATTVGTYTQANKWNTMASNTIISMTSQVSQPVFVSVNDDTERRIRVFRKMLRFTAFFAFPLMFGLALVSKEFIIITISDKWIESAGLLRILCIGGAFFCFHSLYQNLLISMGKSNVYMWINIFQMVLNLALVYLCYKLGLIAVVIAFSCIYAIVLIAWQFMANKYIGLKWLDVMKDICPFAIIAAVTMLLTYFITKSIGNVYVLLIARVVIAAVIYYVILRLLHAAILRECVNFILDFKRRKQNKQ